MLGFPACAGIDLCVARAMWTRTILKNAEFELKDALALPWPVARDYLDAIREAEQGRLYELSLAMRAAGADEKGWRRWVEMVSRPRGKSSQ